MTVTLENSSKYESVLIEAGVMDILNSNDHSFTYAYTTNTNDTAGIVMYIKELKV